MSNPITRLLLIRHAQPREEARGHCYGRLDIGVSVRGQRHAQLLARTLDRIPLSAIYTSPRERARATAEPLATLHGLEALVDERLSELDFGALEGMSYEQIERDQPTLYRQWMETPTRVRFPGGESYSELRTRALAALESIRTTHPGTLVAIVAHGGVLRAMLADCLAMPEEAVFRIEQSYGGISIVDWIDGTPIVRLLNGQVTMVARKRRGFLPALALDSTLEAMA